MISKSNACFSKVVDELVQNCNNLDDDEHSRLALELANCHLKKSGKKTYDCPKYKEFQECSRLIEGDAWNSYTTFYAHAENICFYYRSLIWYSESEKIINKLTHVSQEVSNSIDLNYEKTIKIYNLQQENEAQLNKIYKFNLNLSENLEQTKNRIDDINSRLIKGLTELLEAIKDQEMNLLESIESINTNLSKIKAYQVLIFYESFGIQDALYFIIVYQLLKFVTNHKRLTDSSLAVKIYIILSYLIERVTFEMVSKWNHSYYEINFKTLIKIQRIICLIICLRILYQRYLKNYHESNVKRQNHYELMKFKNSLDYFRSEIHSRIMDSIRKLFLKHREVEKLPQNTKNEYSYTNEITKKLNFD